MTHKPGKTLTSDESVYKRGLRCLRDLKMSDYERTSNMANMEIDFRIGITVIAVVLLQAGVCMHKLSSCEDAQTKDEAKICLLETQSTSDRVMLARIDTKLSGIEALLQELRHSYQNRGDKE